MPDLNHLLDQIDRLDQEATTGPWHEDGDEVLGDFYEDHGYLKAPVLGGFYQNECDAEFIALARTALPQLAAVIRRLRECAQTLTEDNNNASDYASGICEAVECFERIITDALGDDDA